MSSTVLRGAFESYGFQSELGFLGRFRILRTAKCHFYQFDLFYYFLLKGYRTSCMAWGQLCCFLAVLTFWMIAVFVLGSDLCTLTSVLDLFLTRSPVKPHH